MQLPHRLPPPQTLLRFIFFLPRIIPPRASVRPPRNIINVMLARTHLGKLPPLPNRPTRAPRATQKHKSEGCVNDGQTSHQRKNGRRPTVRSEGCMAPPLLSKLRLCELSSSLALSVPSLILYLSFFLSTLPAARVRLSVARLVLSFAPDRLDSFVFYFRLVYVMLIFYNLSIAVLLWFVHARENNAWFP